MRQMHEHDNEENDDERRGRGAPGAIQRNAGNCDVPTQFSTACDRCGGWTAVDEQEGEVKCAHCGAVFGLQSDSVVNFRPGMTPTVRWVGRVVLTILAGMILLAAWALLASRAP